MDTEKLSRPFIAFSIGLGVTGLTAALLTIGYSPPVLSSQLLLLLGAVVVSEAYLLRLESYSVSLTMPLILAAIPIAGPGGACVAAAFSSVSVDDLARRRPLMLAIFNFGQILVCTAAGSWSYVAVRGRLPSVGGVAPLDSHTAPGTLLALLVAALVVNALNILQMSLGVWLGRGVPFVTVFRDLSAAFPTQLALGLVGLLIAQVLAINPVALPLFLFPLFLARQVYQRYAELRDAYLDTVRSLVGALEAKDPYTRGHSERVAKYAGELAAAAGYDDVATETVQRAALLHDIGKLSLPSSLLTKPTGLTEAELLEMRRHPWVGGEMVSRIPALRHLSEYVRCHHERLDGKGYPVGMKGEEIPRIGKILAVADAYDAMTTERAYRKALSHEAAVLELVAESGAQFEPDLVRKFTELKIGRDMLQTGPEGPDSCCPAAGTIS